MRSPSQWLSLGVALAAIAARPTSAADLRDLYFGEVLYQAYQDQYFDAIERLEAGPARRRGRGPAPTAGRGESEGICRLQPRHRVATGGPHAGRPAPAG